MPAALVTGAGGGIGPAVVATLERHGWDVVPSDRDHADLATQRRPRVSSTRSGR